MTYFEQTQQLREARQAWNHASEKTRAAFDRWRVAGRWISQPEREDKTWAAYRVAAVEEDAAYQRVRSLLNQEITP